MSITMACAGIGATCDDCPVEMFERNDVTKPTRCSHRCHTDGTGHAEPPPRRPGPPRAPDAPPPVDLRPRQLPAR